MRATITVDMDSAAFEDADATGDGTGELARILRQVSWHLDARNYTAADGARGEELTLRDANGNRVGELKIV